MKPKNKWNTFKFGSIWFDALYSMNQFTELPMIFILHQFYTKH